MATDCMTFYDPTEKAIAIIVEASETNFLSPLLDDEKLLKKRLSKEEERKQPEERSPGRCV